VVGQNEQILPGDLCWAGKIEETCFGCSDSTAAMNYVQELAVARTAVRDAAQLCEAVRADQHSADAVKKPDNSPVTMADYGAQALICRALQQTLPHDVIVGEEDARLLTSGPQAVLMPLIVAYLRQQVPDADPDEVIAWIDRGNGVATGRFWTLDPIDGTKGYVRGDQYAIALALIEQGQVQLGAIACPALPFNPAVDGDNLGVLFWAVRGGGAFQEPLVGGDVQRLRVSGRSPRTAQLIESVELDHGAPERQQALSRNIGMTRPPTQMDSLAKYGVIARGEADLYLRLTPDPDRRENIWDHAAGVLLLEEAGGKVTDDRGQPLDFGQGAKLLANHGIVASNGVLHPLLLAQLLQPTASF
jgi:3'(2'), 5'-bisphosphate nucleotidase